MRSPAKLYLAGLIIVVAIICVVVMLTTKPKQPIEETTPATADNSLTDYIGQIEKQRDQEREEQNAADKIARQAKAKLESVECKFWQQQKNKNISARTEEKIAQFCTLETPQ